MRRLAGHQLVPGGGARCAGECPAERARPPARCRRRRPPGRSRSPAGRRRRRPAGPRRPCRRRADRLRRRVHVVRGEVGRPGDRAVAVRRQLPDAGDLVAVQQGPTYGPSCCGPGLELPAEQRPVELLGRGQSVHHQAHPAGCAGRVPRCAGRSGRPTPVPRSSSLSLGPSRWPCHFRLRPRTAVACVHAPCRCSHHRAPRVPVHAGPRPARCPYAVSHPFPRDCRGVSIGCTACARSRTPRDRTCPAEQSSRTWTTRPPRAQGWWP